jgi:hypothetical protein
MIAPLVAILLSSGRPCHVARFVSFVVVFAFEGCFTERSLAHVGEECRKVVPSVADLDAASPVVAVLLVALVVAAVEHASPDFTLGGSAQPSSRLFLAAAAFSTPAKVDAGDDNAIAAAAQAVPHGLAITVVSDSRFGGEMVERLVADVDGLDRMIGSHGVSPP